MEDNFSVTIKAARVNAGIRLKDMAIKLGVNTATLINWEKGKTQPPLDKAQQICQITNTPINRITVHK